MLLVHEQSEKNVPITLRTGETKLNDNKLRKWVDGTEEQISNFTHLQEEISKHKNTLHNVVHVQH